MSSLKVVNVAVVEGVFGSWVFREDEHPDQIALAVLRDAEICWHTVTPVPTWRAIVRENHKICRERGSVIP